MPNHRNVYISLATSMSKTGKFQLTPLVFAYHTFGQCLVKLIKLYFIWAKMVRFNTICPGKNVGLISIKMYQHFECVPILLLQFCIHAECQTTVWMIRIKKYWFALSFTALNTTRYLRILRIQKYWLALSKKWI